VYLRQAREADIPNLAKWVGDIEVMKHVTMRTYTSEEESIWFREMKKNADEHVFFICLIEGGDLIGSCGIHEVRNPKTVGIGLFIGDKTQWGKGYGTEAVKLLLGHIRQEFEVSRAWLRVDTANRPAIRCYEKCGFKIYDRHKNPDRIFSNGEEYLMEFIFPGTGDK
jgi:RimJ/RimL family protein N-acetyltransferase